MEPFYLVYYSILGSMAWGARMELLVPFNKLLYLSVWDVVSLATHP